MENIKEYTAEDLRKLGVSEHQIKNLFYRPGWEKRGVYTTIITTSKEVKVIDQETFDNKIMPLLKKKRDDKAH